MSEQEQAIYREFDRAWHAWSYRADNKNEPALYARFVKARERWTAVVENAHLPLFRGPGGTR